jgi:ferredoxin-thioredoxin reductase catalytic subunit
MNYKVKVNVEEINKLYKRLNHEAESSGYHLNPDINFTKDLLGGLLINEQRYGYRACPCRLASGKKSEDLDIICPCDYRDADLNEHGTCYCALYVSKKVLDGLQEIKSIPERRFQKEKSKMMKEKNKRKKYSFSIPIWRCSVCGYLCGRDEPPEICPICKAKKERFKLFS